MNTDSGKFEIRNQKQETGNRKIRNRSRSRKRSWKQNAVAALFHLQNDFQRTFSLGSPESLQTFRQIKPFTYQIREIRLVLKQERDCIPELPAS